MVIVRVRSVRKVWNDSTEMKHRRQLYSQLPGGMYRDAELESLANASRLHALAYPAPERGIEQNHINSCVENIRRKLFEINDDSVCSKGHSNLFTGPPHSVKAEDRIFEIVIIDIFD